MKRAGWLIMLFFFSANCWAQSLADIARKERERQRQIQSNATYSNSGISVTVTAGTSATATTPSTAPQTRSSPPSGTTDTKGRDEKYWRTAFQKGRDDLKRAEEQVVLLDLKIKDLSSQLLQRSDIYNRENTIGPQIAAAQADLDKARKEVEQDKQKINDLEEELRRSGGLPGWAR